MGIVEQSGVQGKVCTICATWKPLSAYRARKPSVGDGYFSQCMDCERARKRAKYAENPEPHQKRAKIWKQEHPEQTQQARDRWRTANRTIEQERARAKRQERGDQLRAYNRTYYTQNKKRLLLKQRKRRAQNPFLSREHARRRRIRLANTPGAHTEAQWLALKAQYGHRCLRCGRAEPEVTLSRDHVVPLGLLGASDDIENIQPLCGACNSWKGRRTIDFRAQPSRLTERRAIYSCAKQGQAERAAVGATGLWYGGSTESKGVAAWGQGQAEPKRGFGGSERADAEGGAVKGEVEWAGAGVRLQA